MGNICLDILQEKWSALYEVRTILLSIQSLLGEPNNDSPLNTHAAELWSNQVAYKKYLLKSMKEIPSLHNILVEVYILTVVHEIWIYCYHLDFISYCGFHMVLDDWFLGIKLYER